MATDKGGFLISFEPERSRLFEERARTGYDFSLELSRLDNSAKTREFFFVCFDGEGKEVSAAAMASYKAGPQNTGARNYRFSDFVFFKPFPVSQLESNVSPGTKSALLRSVGGVARRMPPVAWHEVLKTVSGLRPSVAGELGALWQKVCQPAQIETSNNLQTLALQRDAIGLALDCAKLGDTRREVFRRAKLVDETAKKDSFIAYLEDVAPTQERELVDYDRNAFAGLELPDFSVTGDLSMGRGSRRLHVQTLDKGPLETALGVDLLIYSSDMASLVMIQYKCCENKASEWVYRADGRFLDQMERMREAEIAFEAMRASRAQGYQAPQVQMHQSRLCVTPFYVKFCKRLPLQRQDGELCDGRLLRRTDVATLLELEQTRGPRSGKIVKYDSMPRYMSNSDFSGLVSGGWIGTSHLTPEDLSAVIGRLLATSSRVVLAEARTQRS
ncbi:hypothetical protein [Burkholderia thailandensis]|uniref:hypothetical protein n=1 Tax=Burkholderia thailandensis TaxID=57975 RepID=UPI0022ABCCA2|nr:hypothetical protein [Burkholderia thailandensis]MCZ2900963.1 hypothetical protein [Burkholderia thailandensis]MDD1480957.1 hypothetical protein [Burkholderia thailandensis]MDD1489150.1 hypothetical protein [Burkholderia thailandensis]MDD1493896.1 hypothetical protein [Burkholderia thailandensis]